jgi:hypothetical protein
VRSVEARRIMQRITGYKEEASEARDYAVAEFFNALTGLVKLCEPLIKKAVEEAAEKGK